MKKDENYLLVAQVYIDDIVFGPTIDTHAIEFSEEMKKVFEMSMVGEFTFSWVFKLNKGRMVYSSLKKNMLEILSRSLD